jgi:hypothetical protein
MTTGAQWAKALRNSHQTVQRKSAETRFSCFRRRFNLAHKKSRRQQQPRNKKRLRHKNIQNAMKYIHNIKFKDTDFEIATSTAPEEIKELGKED